MIRFAACILILFLSACVSTSKYQPRSNFTELTNQTFQPSKDLPTVQFSDIKPDGPKIIRRVVKANDRLKMLLKDYAIIGNLNHEEMIEECKYNKKKDDLECKKISSHEVALEKMSDEAAKRGGDTIYVSKKGKTSLHQRTSKQCIEWKTHYYSAPVYNYNAGYSSYNFGKIDRSWDQCTRFESIPENIFDLVQGYEADVFLYNPNLAKVQRTGILYEQAIAEKKNKDLQKLIDSGAPIDTPTIDGLMPISLSAFHGNINAAKILIKNGANINQPTLFGTPLHIAATMGEVSFVKFLLENGANAKAVNEYESMGRKGMNALHYAAGEKRSRPEKSRGEIVQLLLKEGLPVDSTTEAGVTPLMFAASLDSVQAAKALIAGGADVNKYRKYNDDKSKLFPLSYATINNSTEVAKLLIANGADPLAVEEPPKKKGGDATTIYSAAKYYASLKKNIDVYLYLKRLVEGEYGYVDVKGKIVIEPQFDYAYPFSDGVARVAEQTGWEKHSAINKKYGYINKKGKYVIKPQYAEASDFKHGAALVKKFRFGTKSFFINVKNRNICGGATFYKAEPFVGKTTWVQPERYGKYRFVDSNCKNVTKLEFGGVGEYSEGLTLVYYKGKAGYLNSKGKLQVKPQFEKGKEFSEGLAAVRLNKKWGYINTNGQIVIAPQFYKVEDFKGGFAQFKIEKMSGDLIGFINRKGEVIVEPELTSAGNFSELKLLQDISSGDIVDYDYENYVFATKGFLDNQVWIDKKGNILPYSDWRKIRRTKEKISRAVNIKVKKNQEVAEKHVAPEFSEGLAAVKIKPNRSGQ